MNELGTHMLIDFYGCDPGKLSDPEFLKQMSLEGVRRSGATILEVFFKRFETQGVSGVVIISESHFTLHSWPEHSYIGMDFFTCGNRVDMDTALSYFKASLSPDKADISRYARGKALRR